MCCEKCHVGCCPKSGETIDRNIAKIDDWQILSINGSHGGWLESGAKHRMKPIDYFTDLVLSVILIIGIYQFYFWCQRNQMARPRELKSPLDDLIPFRPRWVWI